MSTKHTTAHLFWLPIAVVVVASLAFLDCVNTFALNASHTIQSKPIFNLRFEKFHTKIGRISVKTNLFVWTPLSCCFCFWPNRFQLNVNEAFFVVFAFSSWQLPKLPANE